MYARDVPASIRYPNIGVSGGGTVAGMMAAGKLVMRVANSETLIIPGHLGPVTGFAEVVAAVHKHMHTISQCVITV